MSKKDIIVLKREIEKAILRYTNNLREQNKKEYFNVYLNSFHYLVNSFDKILDMERHKSNVLPLHLTLDELDTIILAIKRDKITDSRAKKPKIQHILEFLVSKYNYILNNDIDNDDDALSYLIKNKPGFV